jgi:hypothetical protein
MSSFCWYLKRVSLVFDNELVTNCVFGIFLILISTIVNTCLLKEQEDFQENMVWVITGISVPGHHAEYSECFVYTFGCKMPVYLT